MATSINEKKFQCALLVVMLSVSTLCGFVPPAKSQSQTPYLKIFITADGNVNCSDAPIQRNGNRYTLTGDIYGEIIVLKDNIVIDGAGHKLLGRGYNETYGVIINNRNNVALINTEISGFHLVE